MQTLHKYPIYCYGESAEPVPHVSAGKGTMSLRMQGQSIIQRCHRKQCVLMSNAFEKSKTNFHWLWVNESREHARALFQRKSSESIAITQTFLISVCVKSTRRLV